MILDRVLLLVFGTLAALGLAGATFCFAHALKAARRSDGELPMVFWAFAGLAGLVVAGAASAYFLIPILLH